MESLVRFVEFSFFFMVFVIALVRQWRRSAIPPALYVLLWGAGSSLLRGSVMYVIRLPIHGVISP
jgi:hypothetical protein